MQPYGRVAGEAYAELLPSFGGTVAVGVGDAYVRALWRLKNKQKIKLERMWKITRMRNVGPAAYI